MLKNGIVKAFVEYYKQLDWYWQQPFHVPVHILGGMLFTILFGGEYVLGWAIGLEFGQGFRLRQYNRPTTRKYEIHLLIDAIGDILTWLIGIKLALIVMG